MTVEAYTAIPISFLVETTRKESCPESDHSLSTRDSRRSKDYPSSEMNAAATSLLALGSTSEESDTIVVAQNQQRHRPAPINAVPYSGTTSASNSSKASSRKRTAEHEGAQSGAPKTSKRPRRTRGLSNRVVHEPLTPPATPPAIAPEAPSQAQSQSHVNSLPPTSIVTKRNRVTQEFRNGVTSVQVPPAGSAANPSQTESGVESSDLTSNPGNAATPACKDEPEAASTPDSPPTEVSSITDSREGIPQTASQNLAKAYAHGQPAVNWDCHTHVIQDQKIYTTYEKPSNVPSSVSTANPNLPPQAYNKMTTKTVTITITTTIATTEILRPGEPGYEDALERHRKQSRLTEPEKERLRREYEGSKIWASPEGARRLNAERHWRVHRGAQPEQIPNFEPAPGTSKLSNTENQAARDGQGPVQEGIPTAVRKEERQVQVKVEVPEDATMEDLHEAVRVKIEEIN